MLMCVCITCVQLRQPLVKQTPTEGDNMKAGGYPFVNRDQNPGTGCAAVRLLVSRVRDRPVVIFGDVACCVCRAFACIAFPFQNQNTGETLASLDPLSVTTKATIYDSAHVLEKAMLLEKVPYQP